MATRRSYKIDVNDYPLSVAPYAVYEAQKIGFGLFSRVMWIKISTFETIEAAEKYLKPRVDPRLPIYVEAGE